METLEANEKKIFEQVIGIASKLSSQKLQLEEVKRWTFRPNQMI
jgi:hypothetical protein